MNLGIRVQYGIYRDSRTDKQSVRVDVFNGGNAAAFDVKLEFVYEYEKPQDVSLEFARPGMKAVHIEQSGRSVAFVVARGCSNGPLEPGERRRYLYPPFVTAELRSLVQSLSPERYRVAITANGRTGVAIPGDVFGEFVQNRLADE
ncbi:MAG: hypothetical protein GXY83_20425 [Rhodopirellula sp.]|nr:hypothetical protein [Rhodopirellula sp.]